MVIESLHSPNIGINEHDCTGMRANEHANCTLYISQLCAQASSSVASATTAALHLELFYCSTKDWHGVGGWYWAEHCRFMLSVPHSNGHVVHWGLYASLWQSLMYQLVHALCFLVILELLFFGIGCKENFASTEVFRSLLVENYFHVCKWKTIKD